MRIILVDDDNIVLDSLEMILTGQGVEVLGKAINGEMAVELYEELRPDLVLMDIRMEGMNGIETSEKILLMDPEAKILLLTTFQDDEYIRKGMAMGIKGYILKQNVGNLLASLNVVYSGSTVMDSQVSKRLSAVSGTPCKLPDDITNREEEILRLVAEGKNNREISAELYISEGTVKNHISSLLDKLGLRDRTQLVVYYYKGTSGKDKS
ncbi:response regulator transcription factor [Peptoniphilaceae bacterium SGI.131]